MRVPLTTYLVLFGIGGLLLNAAFNAPPYMPRPQPFALFFGVLFLGTAVVALITELLGDRAAYGRAARSALAGVVRCLGALAKTARRREPN